MMISSLINIMVWWLSPINGILLFIDGIVYSLVAYSYKLFMIMTQLNLNIIYELASPIVDRVKALIMVFVLFKLAITLITYLLNPDEVKGSSKLVTNIIVAVILLLSYDFIFELGNDLSMIALGSTNSNAYQILDAPEENDGGLIARFIFGSNSAVSDTKNFGVYLSASTLNIFLHDINDGGVASQVYNDILSNSETSVDFSVIKNLNSEIDRTVEYHWPIISTVVGIYLVYTIATIAIQIGVRMFKLLILQIIAPIPISAIISEGYSGKSFSSYMKLYTSTLLDAIIRVAIMYLATAFVGTFYNLILSGDLVVGENKITTYLILIIIVVAIYQFVRKLPDFLKQIFPGMNFESNMGGFGRTLRTIGAVGAGAGGLALGAVAGASAGGVVGMFQGAIGGAAAGYRGQGVRGALENVQRVQQSAANRAAVGGLGNSLLNALGAPIGVTARRQNNAQQDINRANETIANIDKAEEKAKSELSRATGVTFGGAGSRSTMGAYTFNNVSSAEDLANRVISRDVTATSLQAAMNNTASSDAARATAARQYAQRCDQLREQAQIAYNEQIDATTAITTSGLGDTATRQTARAQAEADLASAQERYTRAGGQ